MSEQKRFNIEPVPLISAFISTDKFWRIRLSADIIALYGLRQGNRIAVGYDPAERAIAIRQAASDGDPTAAVVDKRGYISARRFFNNKRIPAVARRYDFVAEQDGWLVFIAEDTD